MYIVWEVAGYYERFADEGEALSQTSLVSLFTDLRVIATQQKRHSLSTFHQSFGLNFLPVNTLTHLIHKTSRRSPLLAEQTLYPQIQNPESLLSQKLQCRFVTTQLIENFAINLKHDDVEIPDNFIDRYVSSYRIKLGDVSNALTQDIQIHAINELEQFVKNHPVEVLNFALSSINPKLFSIPLSNGFIAWLDLNDLEASLQQALQILRNTEETALLSEFAQELVNAYRIKYPCKQIIGDDIPDLVSMDAPSTDIKIGRGIHRQTLEELIFNARQFLLICSYRLEDEAIVEMIVEKSRQIPVWILTDFSNEVQDRVDANMDGTREAEQEYANADRKKRECLRMLSRANLGFRSGNFHLKTYISDQSAYLGSCNLTGGSLERNGEAGMLWHSTPEHAFLVKYFRYLWTSKANAQVIPSPLGFRTESLENSMTPAPINNCLLDQAAYKVDLTNSLRRFAGQEIRIYSRNFQPLSPQLNLLSPTRSRIFYGNHNATGLQAKQIFNLHAKIVIIGSHVAYIGSQDFSFRHNPFIDLTYKTTNFQEIEVISHQARNLY